MRKYLLLSVIFILSITPVITSAHDECNFVGLVDAWAGATVEGMPNGAVYGYLVNLGTETDTLLTVSTDVAEFAEVHETTINDEDVMRMQPLNDGLMVMPHNYAQLQRGGYHIMLINLLQQLEDGSTFDITLVFESAGEVVVTVPVHNIEHMMDDMSMDMNHDMDDDDDMKMDDEDDMVSMDHEHGMKDMPMMVEEACGGVHVLGAWARPGVAMPNSATYALLVNLGASDVTLVSATGSVAEAIELHEMTMTEDDVMRMSPIEGGVLIPAGGVAQLKPGGLHIMMIGLTEDLEAGNSISLTLIFDDDAVIEVEVPVQEPMEDPMMMHD
jgi:copper(I)-binding protein